MMYTWTPKGYKYVEQDDLDPDPMYAIGEWLNPPVIDNDDPEVYSNWLEACDMGRDDAERAHQPVSIWQITPEKFIVAIIFPKDKD